MTAADAPRRAPRVTAAADDILRRVALLDNPYFRALRDGTMALESFRAGQQHFFHAVRYFPRPMAALAARIPDPADRLDLLHNLVEEHGDFHTDQFHANTFAAFLQSVGGRRPDANAYPPPAVHAFNSILMAACASDELEVGVGCMGVIEYAFADVSAAIGQAVVARGWVARGDLVHYALHAELDVRHADEFFALVEPRWDDPARRASIHQGLELGTYAFDQLYRAMLTAAPPASPPRSAR